MSRKDMHRSDWKRVLKKKYTARDVLASGIPCKESLLLIEEVSIRLQSAMLQDTY